MKHQTYKNIQIFGPFNSGTNLIARIMRYGLVEPFNMKAAGGTHICKHTIKAHVLEENVRKNKDTLFICMYRPMAYWVESIKNNLYDLVWDKNIKNPCMFRNVKYDTVFHLHKAYYDAYKNICSKYSNVIWLEYNILINKEIAYQYLNNKLFKTNLQFKSKEKIISILEKPSKNPNNEYGKNCDQALTYLQDLKQKAIENKYVFSRETKEFFELGI
jgi:hypothetical protein